MSIALRDPAAMPPASRLLPGPKARLQRGNLDNDFKITVHPAYASKFLKFFALLKEHGYKVPAPDRTPNTH